MQLPALDTRAIRYTNVVRFAPRQLRSRSGQAVAFRRISARLVESPFCSGLIPAMTRAEINGEISEFQALFLRAILAMIEGSDTEPVRDYLDMAEFATSSQHERAAIAEARAACHARPTDLRALVARCLASLDLPCRPCGRIAA